MGFIKYSVSELGVQEDIPGWVKQAKEAEAAVVEAKVEEQTPPVTANINAEEDKAVTDKE